MASRFEPRSGATPPSSPTAVASPRSRSSAFRAWNTSAPHRTASRKDGTPHGTTMNSCTSTLLSACAPPFTTFIIGTGIRGGGWPASAARCS